MLKIPADAVVVSQSELDALIRRAAKSAAAETLKLVPREKPRPAQVTQKQAAEMLGLSPPTVKKLIDAGVLARNACGLIPVETIDAVLLARVTNG